MTKREYNKSQTLDESDFGCQRIAYSLFRIRIRIVHAKNISNNYVEDTILVLQKDKKSHIHFSSFPKWRDNIFNQIPNH